MVTRFLPLNLTKTQESIVGNSIDYAFVKLVMDDNYNLVTATGSKIINENKDFDITDEYSIIIVNNTGNSNITYKLPTNPDPDITLDFFIEESGVGFRIDPNGKNINGSSVIYESTLMQYQSMKLIYVHELDGWRVIKTI